VGLLYQKVKIKVFDVGFGRVDVIFKRRCVVMAGITFFGDWVRLKAQLKKLQLETTDTKRLNKRIAVYIRESTLDRFDNQESPEGEAWKPLSPTTVEMRNKRTQKEDDGGGGNDNSSESYNILVDSSILKSSITLKVLAAGAAVGTNEIYAAIQQVGGNAGRSRKVTIPSRPYLGLSKQDTKEIKTIIEEFAEEMSI
jgi:phage virion morphogenesis protein